MTGRNTPCQWLLKEVNEQDVVQLQEALKIGRMFATILVGRGIRSKDVAQAFLHPSLQSLHDPDLLPDMQVAVNRIRRAIVEKEQIFLYGDYDVDGITATALLYQCLRMLKACVDYYIPHRLLEGYGIHASSMPALHEKGAKLIITLDCGISGYEAVEAANALGIDVIVTDHHELGEKIPHALAVIDPKDRQGHYPFSGITGVGVAFKLAWALCRFFSPGLGNKVRPEFRQFLSEAMGLVALGTIADVAPLCDENRAIARYGLGMLEQSGNQGIRALKEVARLQDVHPLTPEHIGFWIGPRLNAMGRLEHAMDCVKLLITQDAKSAMELAQRLDLENQRRKKIQEKIYEEALAQIGRERLEDNRVLVLASEGWHAGVVGIVASALQDKYYRPVCMIAVEDGIGKGSARSIPGFHLFEALKECASHLVHYGGHELAAGFKIRKEKIPDFSEAMNKRAGLVLKQEHLQPSLEIAAAVRLPEITWQLFAEIEKLSPFGEGNREPVFACYNIEVAPNQRPERCGVKKEHLRFMVGQDNAVFKVIAFGQGAMCEQLLQYKQCHLAFIIKKNVWNGETTLELECKDIQVDGTGKK
jgi:single-stranded-DNA-specific exonuclease